MGAWGCRSEGVEKWGLGGKSLERGGVLAF